MSGALVSAVLNSALPPWVRQFAVVLASCGRDDGSKIFPSVATVARMAGKSRRQATRAIRMLRALGVITPVGRAPRTAQERGGKLVVVYRFNVRALPLSADGDQLGLFHTQHDETTPTNRAQFPGNRARRKRFPQSSTGFNSHG